MKRKRIVINLDEAPAGGAAPYRSGKRLGGGFLLPLLVIAVVLLVIIAAVGVGGYVWWHHYQSSPAYSLALLVDASQRNDTATIDTLLDTDKVTEDFVSQVRERTTGSLLNSINSSQIDSTIATLMPKLKPTVHEEFLQELHRLTEPAAGKPFILVALVIGQFADVKEEGDSGRAQVNIRGEQIQLTMQKNGEHWQVIAAKDDRLAKLIADAILKNLPTKNGQIPDDIRKQLDRFLNPEK
jgi:hypothetical protein